MAGTAVDFGWTLVPNAKVPAGGQVRPVQSLGLFLGNEVQNSLHMVEGEEEGVTLGGYVGDPSCDQGSTQLQYLFLNGRWVRDRGLLQAVQDAYQGLLMTGRYPVAFLFLDVPPERVDVNVHPAKSEVRFRDRDALYELVRRVVREAVQQAHRGRRLVDQPPCASTSSGRRGGPGPGG